MADIPISPGAAALTATGAAATLLITTPTTASIRLPALRAFGATQDMQLQPISASGSVLNGTVVTFTADLPSIGASGTILAGNNVSADIDIPAIDATGDGGVIAGISLPKLDIDSTVIPGNVLRQSSSLPKLGAIATVISDGIATADISLKPITLTTSILSGSVMTGTAALKRLALAASGYTGNVVTAEISVPAIALEGTAYGENSLTATITIPMLRLVAAMGDAATSSTTVFAMNTKSTALTNYVGLEFNSATRFNGVDLVANESGIFAITGDLDGAAIIDAYATLASSNFGTMQLKRVQSVYLGYRADGEMRLKATIDEHHEYEYQVQPRNYDDIHGNRVKLGKGAKGTYWQLEIGNVDGSDFDLDTIQLEAIPLARKTG
jgi:hypothetical protein